MISLGRVQPIFKGTYDPNTTYYKLDNVFYNGETWVCKIDSIKGSVPADGSAYWQKVASKGDTGAQGPVGPQGPPGEAPVVDDVLSEESENPVQNKVIAAALQRKANAGNLLPKIGQFPTYSPGLTIVWNEDKSQVRITGARNSEWDLNLYEAETIGTAEPVLSEYLEYGKTYPVLFTSDDESVTLYIIDATGTHEYVGNGAFLVQENTAYWMLGIRIAASQTIDATVTISMPEAATLAEVTEELIEKQASIDLATTYALEAYPTNTVSGSVATFPDGADGLPVKSLVAQIKPVQDLHGYDAPWPGGSGKNLLDEATVSPYNASSTVVYNQQDGTISVSGSMTYAAGQIVVQLQAGVTYAFSAHVIQATAQTRFGLRGETGAQLIASASGYATSDSDLSFTYTPTEDMSVRITLLSSWSQANDETAIFSKVQCEVGSEPTTYAPYENLCPISGWTGAVIGQAPERIFDPAVIKTVQGGISSSTGAASSFNLLYRIRTGYFPVKPSTEYVVYFNLPYFWFYEYEALDYTTYTKTNDERRRTGYTFTTLPDTYYLRLVFAKSKNSSSETERTSPEDLTYCNVFEVGTGRQVEISWQTEAGTVYGGEIELVSGELKRTRKKGAIQSVQSVGTASSGIRYADCGIVSDAKPSGIVETEIYANSNNASTNNAIRLNGTRLYVYDNRLTDLATAQELLVGLEIVYELAEPQPYQLPGTTIPTRKGTNNMWADTGDVAVNYRADTKMYIDAQTKATRNLIAGIETSMTASKAYSAGDMLIVDDTLYKAATAIASGATLTPGTNVNQTTVAEQLLLLANA